jgi:methyltransferase (TIGR00027 family)
MGLSVRRDTLAIAVMPDPSIESISDTACWVALYRAMESERSDAHFRDPYARRLAGTRGEDIARTLPRFHSGLWPMVVRTCVFDELIERAVSREGADTIVNLASGLDARPWRMRLPPTLRWIDVDLPEMLAYKKELLAGEHPACAVESFAADLTDAAARRALFERIGRDSRKTLVLSEGLLVYLTADEAAALATDLHAPESLRWWAIDIVSPSLLRRLNKRWAPTLAAGRAILQFAPENGTRFFEPFGWKEIEYRSTFEEGHRLKRQMRGAWILRLVGQLSSAASHEKMRRMGGIALLERT